MPVKHIEKLPKAELHVHLMGAVPLTTLDELAKRHPPRQIWDGLTSQQQAHFCDIAPHIPALVQGWSDRSSMRRLMDFHDFPSFLYSHAFADRMILDRDDLCLLATSVAEHLAAQNMVYAEITFCPVAYRRVGMDFNDFSAAFDAADKVDGIEIRWIADLVRDAGAEHAIALASDLRDWKEPRMMAINLGGSEHLYPAHLFEKAYSIARQAGLRCVAHAGEAAGPESVREAVEILQVERIGHGVSAARDDRVMLLLQNRDITVEICINSNLKTGACQCLADHPLPLYAKRGICCTLNTDDPTFFRTDLVSEAAQGKAAGLSDKAVISLFRAGFERSFLDKSAKKSYLSLFDNAVLSDE